MLWCEFMAPVNCLVLLVMQTFVGVINDKQAHDALCLGSTTGVGILMQKDRAVLALLYICRKFLLIALGDTMEFTKRLIYL